MYSDFLKDLSEVHNSKTEWFVHNMYKTVEITMDGDKSRIGIHCNCFVYNNHNLDPCVWNQDLSFQHTGFSDVCF